MVNTQVQFDKTVNAFIAHLTYIHTISKQFIYYIISIQLTLSDCFGVETCCTLYIIITLTPLTVIVCKISKIFVGIMSLVHVY